MPPVVKGSGSSSQDVVGLADALLEVVPLVVVVVVMVDLVELVVLVVTAIVLLLVVVVKVVLDTWAPVDEVLLPPLELVVVTGLATRNAKMSLILYADSPV